MNMRACLMLLMIALPQVVAAVDGRQLSNYQEAFVTFNADRPEANHYRAGVFSGYLAGVLDTLEGSRICLRVCRCEVEDKVAAWLREHPAELDRPVASWLVPLLERDYPCL